MHAGLNELTAKEKETLRLVLMGHDAKSSARELGVSVHTINERLRDARRKLGVTSSKEAARLLLETEQGQDNRLGYRDLGVAGLASPGSSPALPARRWWRSPILWISGVAIVIIAILASALLLAQGRGEPLPLQTVAGSPAEAGATAAAETSARAWLAHVDKGEWEKSWSTSAAMFQNQITAQRWASMIEPIRKPLGAVASRNRIIAEQRGSLPGAPAGDYVILQFLTSFGAGEKKIETVVLMREGTSWKVSGYFLKPA